MKQSTVTPTESILSIINDMGYEFEPLLNGDSNSYLLNEEDMMALCEQVWNRAIRISAEIGYNYGKGTATEEAILINQI